MAMKRIFTANRLLIFLLVYGAASLLHHFHNAVFLDLYPNMPAWLSPARVYAAWLGVTTVGLVGYLLDRLGYRFTGLIVIAVYGALGLGGLAHYRLAPWPAHTLGMNVTIWLEVITGLTLIAVAGSTLRKGLRTS